MTRLELAANYTFVLCLFIISPLLLEGQTTKGSIDIEKATRYYKTQQYPQAEHHYRLALALEPNNQMVRYNLAATLYKQNAVTPALEMYNTLIQVVKDKTLLSKAWYNKGVILSATGQLSESIEAYKNALRNNATDVQARENLQKALLELKRKQNSPPSTQPKQSKADQQLQQLQQKEMQVQQKVQQHKTPGAGAQTKDW
ncbi:MAG: hypothetical protein RL115_1720 [Bacteroidota bacterium]|jgi:Ca-activated chloride channel family protein